MKLVRSIGMAAVALTAAIGVSGASSTADAKHFKKHHHFFVVKPHVYPYPYYTGYTYVPSCYWSHRMQAYGYWRHGMFFPCGW